MFLLKSVEFQRTIWHYIPEEEFCITTAVKPQVLHTSELVTSIKNEYTRDTIVYGEGSVVCNPTLL
jgi:hypothetical protein